MTSHLLRSLGVLSVTALLAVAGCTSSKTEMSGKDVRIGLEAPLSGDQKDVGTGMLHGAQLAAAEVNAGGGVNGRTITIVPIDDAADPEKGVVAAKAAIAGGLSAVVGPYNSGVGMRTLPLYLASGVFPFRLTTADSTQGLGFTLQPMTAQIAPVATAAIIEWAKATRVALMFDDTQAYTKDANAAMKTALSAAGVTVSADVAIAPGATDYSAKVTEATASKPQLVYVITYYREGGLIARAMFDMKTTVKCLADFGAYDSGFVASAGADAARQCPLVGVPAPEDFPAAAPRVNAFAARFSTAPGTWSPHAYDSVMMLVAAAKSVGSFDAARIRSFLASEKGWAGWTGTVGFDASTGNRVPAPVVVVATRPDGTLHIDQAWVSSTNFAF